MTTPVSPTATTHALESLRVRNPVASADLARLADEFSFLNGHNVNTIVNAWIPDRPLWSFTTVGTKRYPFASMRSAGSRVVRITVQLHPADNSTSTLNISLPSGAAWLIRGKFDGSTPVRHPSPLLVAQPVLEAYVDVSGCTPGALLYWIVECVAVSGSNAGVIRLSATEVPLASLDPVSSAGAEPGLDAAWTMAGNRLWDGSASTSYGLARVHHLLDQARKYSRKHFSLVRAETSQTDLALWGTPNNNVGGPWDGSTTDFAWYLPIRNLYENPSGSETWRAAVRYRTQSTNTGTFQMLRMGVGGAAETTVNFPLASTAGAWAWADQTVTMPQDGTGGLVRLRFRLQSSNGNYVQLASATLIDQPP